MKKHQLSTLSERIDGGLAMAIIWDVDDVHEVGIDRPECVVTDEQAREVLKLLLKKHDMNNGITWETVECAIDSVLDKHNEGNKDEI